MNRLTPLRSFLAMVMAAAALCWGAGTGQAYLKPDQTPIGPGDTPDFLTTPNWAYTPPLRKFVDSLPGLSAANKNNLNQFISVAHPDTVTYPGSDYYEIELRQYTEKMHSDLNPTTLRGYVQVNNGTDIGACGNACTAADNTVAPDPGPHYLGPMIIAQKDRPVRIKFINKLPTGAGGDLFVPVDVSQMGAGPFEIDYDPVTKDPMGLTSGNFTQNRATIHLHGGVSPWISDGTPHQWITPAGENTEYPKGVSVKNVPDMPDPGPGAQTFYYTNQQSARLMFFHDHAWGITRLNVYVGEAAGYLIRDDTEQALIDAGIIPSGAYEIPLVLQDKTFVDPNTITSTDPTWAWGTNPWTGTPGDPMTPVQGDLWWPHVYMPAQNPYDMSGIAPMGRWAYGPWFWPPTTGVPYGPVANPYYSVNCDPADATTPGSYAGFCQAPEIPGTPNPSWGAEAFLDTPVINGTAYPYLEVEPRPYRLRILNAAHDRFFNLQLYEADTTVPAGCPTCAVDTEVKMVPAYDYSGDATWPATWPTDGRPGGAPDWKTAGPDFIQIGTEGGFLPQPVVRQNQPVTWNNDVTTFNAGNVNNGTVILGPAERVDVIVDFSQFAGKTLILYNDAPAPWPALDPHYDYFTGNPDMTEAGGAAPTLVGMGPNTRTIMQIKVAAGAGVPFDLTALQQAFDPAGGGPGVFQQGQNPIIVGQSAYNTTYNTTFPTTYPNWGISRIQDNSLSFRDVNGIVQTVAMQPKSIQDEMGEVFDDYGRMSAKIGLEMAQTSAGIQTFIVQNYVDPSTEVLNDNEVQIWKITHNGVDTHPLHFHLYDVQVINRVGWDGFIRLPDPNELGWKDTVRISPLEDTIVAMRPVSPDLPFGVPESIRPLNPMEPIGSSNGFTNLDPLTGQPVNPPTTNEMFNFDWEYVIHCHILSHEENDMMRPVIFNFLELLPEAPTSLLASSGTTQVDLTWNDTTPVDYTNLNTFGNSANEVGFIVERSPAGGNSFTQIGTALANATSYSDATAGPNTSYDYRVSAYNAAGSSPFSNTATGNATAPPPATGATLAANPPSPQLSGTQVTFTAGGAGGSGTYEYRFSINGPGTNNVLTVVRAYSASSTFLWTPALTDIGNTTVVVDVRSAGSTAGSEAAASLIYRAVPPPATGATLGATPASPQVTGTQVTFTAAGAGGSGTYEYRFSINGPGTNNVLTVVQPYSAGNLLLWTPTMADIGADTTVVVDVRSAGSLTDSEAAASMIYRAVPPPATDVTLGATPASPRRAGTQVTFTANGSGGSGTYEYLFRIRGPRTNNAWVVVQGYSTSRRFVWRTRQADIGLTTINVRVRSVGSVAGFEAQRSINYRIQ
ncbi:MAG: multicopper oxidase domain-containing protein [Thermodesulfobacteriota bacterium]